MKALQVMGLVGSIMQFVMMSCLLSAEIFSKF
jgi:hypothetical protein